MKVFDDYQRVPAASGPPGVVTIGNFDGVHLGHRAVLGEGLAAAKTRGAELAVLTFEPHPASILRRDVPAMRLASPSRKLELLERCGVDLVLAQRFDREFASMEPEPFAERILAGALRAGLVVVGGNFRFGAARAGDVEALRTLGADLGFDVLALDVVGTDGERVSSSRIREALAAGDLRLVATMLGRPHEISGVVVAGKGDGRRLGFPTANLDEVNVLLPPSGIYAARCRLRGATVKAAVYLGDRPTLGHGPAIEAHLIGVDGDLYGERLVLELVERVRAERRFEGVDSLRRQMALDVARIVEILKKVGHG